MTSKDDGMSDKEKIQTRLLALFDETKEGPLSDEEIKNVRDCAWEFLLDDGKKGYLAYLIYRMAEEIQKTRAMIEPKISNRRKILEAIIRLDREIKALLQEKC